MSRERRTLPERPLIERRVTDPVVRGFWLNEYAGYSRRCAARTTHEPLEVF